MNMTEKKRILAGMLVLALALSGCGAKKTEETESTDTAGVAVQVKTVSSESIATDNKVSAQVAAEDQATIMVAVNAKCTAVYVDAGDEVKKGDVLCKLDMDSTLSSYSAAQIGYNSAQQNYNDQAALFDQQIALAEKQIEMADQQITQAQDQIAVTERQIELMGPQIALAEKNVTDTEALFAIGAASQLELDNAKIQADQLNFSREQAKLGLEQAKYQVTALEVQKQNAQLQVQQLRSTKNSTLSQMEAGIQSSLSSVQQMDNLLEDVDSSGNVIAPISGTLVTFNATENNYIPTTMPLAVIDAGDQMKLVASVSEALVPKLHAGDTADVSISAVSRTLTATIRSVERSASAQTRLYTVTLSLPEGESQGLLAGMFADVTFHTDRVEDTVVVPSEAILTSGSTQFVYVVEGEQAKYVQVTTGLTGSGVTEILSGLSGGERLVTVGQSYLSDGDPVRVVSEG